MAARISLPTSVQLINMDPDPVLGITRRTTLLRAKNENITSLETENAILHIQAAQLQHCLKKSMLHLKPYNHETEYLKRCRNCATFKEKTVVLCEQAKLLKEQLTQLHLHYLSLEQQIVNRLQHVRAVIPAILQRQTSQRINDLQTKYAKERHRRKSLHNALVELRGNIRVHCRVRPVLGFDRGAMKCVRCIDDETVQVRRTYSSASGTRTEHKAFEFERVHSPSDTQSAVFSEVQPLMVSLLDGYNVCIMAYGQTGSGKTHTVLGSFKKHNTDGMNGVIPQAAHELFRLIEERELDVNISVSIMEIYNEKIKDLLSNDRTVHHEVVSCRNGSMEVTHLTKRPVLTSEEMISVVHHGMRQRATGSTLIHDRSSRSHLIVTLHINQPPSSRDVSTSTSYNSLNNTISPVQSVESTPMVSPHGSPPYQSTHSRHKRPKSWLSDESGLCVKLQFVDLAGSECVGMSGVSGSSLRETQSINKSLASLSDVLVALAEKRRHIPYRNSTLTHLLQDSIGCDSKMVLLLCISPTAQCIGESLRVLGFGQRARQVQRKACWRRQPKNL